MDKVIADTLRERLRKYDNLQAILAAGQDLLVDIANKDPLQIEIKHGGSSILFRRGGNADVLISFEDTEELRQALSNYVEQHVVSLRHQIADLV